MDEWPKTKDLHYFQGERYPWEFSLVGLEDITGLGSTLEIDGIGSMSGIIQNAATGAIAFDPDDLPALLVATAGAYAYTMTLDPGGAQERVVLEGEVVIRLRKVS